MKAKCSIYTSVLKHISTVNIQNIEVTFDLMINIINIFRPQEFTVEIANAEREKVLSSSLQKKISPAIFKKTTTSKFIDFRIVLCENMDWHKYVQEIYNCNPEIVTFSDCINTAKLENEFLSPRKKFANHLCTFNLSFMFDEKVVDILYNTNIHDEIIEAIKRQINQGTILGNHGNQGTVL